MKTVRAFIGCCIILLPGCSKKSEPPTSPPTQPPDTVTHVIRPQHDIPWPSLSQSAWPKPLHDAQCTGRSSFPGPIHGRTKCIIPLSQYTTDATMGVDSVFYVVSDTTLYAFSLNGTSMWKVTIGADVANYNPPMLAANGNIYVGVYDGISAYSDAGMLVWHTKLNGRVILKSCALGLDGTLYVVAGYGTLYAIDQSGQILWQQNAPSGNFTWGSQSTISFAPDGSKFYVGGSTPQQSLFVISTSGAILRTDSLGGYPYGAISLDVDGNVFACFDRKLVSISPSGTIRWTIGGLGNSYNVCIDPDGNIAYLSYGRLYSVDNEGKKRWSVPVNSLDDITHLVCDSRGTIYVETSSDMLTYDVQAISSTGSVLWTLNLPAYVKTEGTSLTREGYLLFPQSGYYPRPKQMYVID